MSRAASAILKGLEGPVEADTRSAHDGLFWPHQLGQPGDDRCRRVGIACSSHARRIWGSRPCQGVESARRGSAPSSYSNSESNVWATDNTHLDMRKLSLLPVELCSFTRSHLDGYANLMMV